MTETKVLKIISELASKIMSSLATAFYRIAIKTEIFSYLTITSLCKSIYSTYEFGLL